MNVLGKPDPFLDIAQSNARDKAGSDYVWALRNLNFDVQQGEVLGVVGKNGAGKSTLLKILAKVTAPTTGNIKIKGRIASLLEVGTGFHPELTGRENIFLNGAVLGMRKAEIKAKFDEIVDFSGVERYIDTPVKRYSSGMYVRLAFAVAAHLEPDILIVDEVLAVGDAEFQKKCIGKIQSVSQNDGRTVLFVSHNMTSIADLCTKCLYMKQGEILMYDSTRNVIGKYLQENSSSIASLDDVSGIKRDFGKYGQRAIITAIGLKKENFFWKEAPEFSFTVNIKDKNISNYAIGFALSASNGSRLFTYNSDSVGKVFTCNDGETITYTFKIDEPVLVPSTYYVSVGIRSNLDTLDAIDNCFSFGILETDEQGNYFGFTQGPEISGYIDTTIEVGEKRG